MADENVSCFAARSDAQLAEFVKERNSDAFAELTARYMSAIRAKASPFHAGGTETEDLCQEGLLGLLRAAQTFDPGNGASFRTYANVCISNRILMARRTAGKKSDPLSNFVSLNSSSVSDFTQCSFADPEALLDDSESFKAICRKAEKILTPMEFMAMSLYLGGCSYREIAQKMSVTEKAADNALQRVRFKLRHTKLIAI